MQKMKKSCRKLAQKLSYMDTPYEEPPLSARSGGTSSASLRTPAGSSQSMTSARSGATSAVHTPPHHSAGKDPATEDDGDDDPLGFRRQHDQWDNWSQDEIGMSQLDDAPLGTQGASQVLTKVISLNTYAL